MGTMFIFRSAQYSPLDDGPGHLRVLKGRLRLVQEFGEGWVSGLVKRYNMRETLCRVVLMIWRRFRRGCTPWDHCYAGK